MKLIQIYQCFCDETRLRILNLLQQTPLCGCHFQSILGEPQVKISKHLSYLKTKGLVEANRHQNWMIYQLPASLTPELERNLQCLQDCVQTVSVFKNDLKKLVSMRAKIDWLDAVCCKSAPKKSVKKSSKNQTLK